MNTFLTIFIFFSVIVFIHELGHFCTAKFFGVEVNEFALGMGPTLLKKQVKETLYTIRIIPVGGFCRLEGDEHDSEKFGAYCKKNWYERLIIILSGGFMNLLLGFFLCFIMILSSKEITSTCVDNIREESNAYMFLETGDKITEINGKKVHILKDIESIMSQNVEEKYNITIKRNGKILKASLTPQYYEINGNKIPKIGFEPKRIKANFFNALRESYYLVIWMIKVSFYSLFALLKGMVSIKEMSGIVGAATMVAHAAKTGIFDVLFLCAFISVNIGLFNLLPIPALDGGRAFFIFLELIRKKPIKTEHEGMVHFIGFAALIILSLFVTFNDILRIIKINKN